MTKAIYQEKEEGLLGLTVSEGSMAIMVQRIATEKQAWAGAVAESLHVGCHQEAGKEPN